MKKLNKYIIIFMLLFPIPFVALSQISEEPHINDSIENEIYDNLDSDNIKKNTVFFELLGNGVLYSIAFERLLVQQDNHSLAFATGFTYIPNLIADHSFLFSPQIKYYIGLGDNKPSLVLGIGLTSYIPQERANVLSNYAYFVFYRIGLFYEKTDRNSFYSIALTPFRLNDPNGMRIKILPSVGISFGKRF